MRVLHVNGGNIYGGIEVLLVTLARLRGLCPEMAPGFALCFPGRTHDELVSAGVATHLLGPARLSRPWTVWRSRRRLRNVLRQGNYDVVVCHSSWSLALFAPVVRSAGVPLVMWLHDAPPAPRLHWLDRLASWNPPDWTIVNSEHTRRWLPKLFPGDNNTRLYYPIEFGDRTSSAAARQATRIAHGADAHSIVLLQVGRWDPYKGHLLFMEALGRLSQLPGWVCWQAGGVSNPGEERYFRTVQAAARRHGIEDRVRFLGFLSNQTELPGVFAAADLYCQPNIAPEPFGIVVIEALQAGLPVVSSAFGGPAEIVDATCGMLVPPNNAEALADALAHLIGAHEVRRRLGANGPARARSISDPTTCLRQLSETLHRLCQYQPEALASDC